jgi:V-type H+-transporting ATPase subunit F
VAINWLFYCDLPLTDQIANEIRYLLDDYDRIIPTVLEIPSKDSPYEPEKDTIMASVNRFLGVRS